MELKPGAHVHLMGIGGFGISAIARVLLERGYTVSGCDLTISELAEKLSERGAKVIQGHNASHIKESSDLPTPDALIMSSAVADDNPEVAAARAEKIPVYKRSDIMGFLMAGQDGVAIAGTHGKTTTTSMAAYMLGQAGLDPTYIVGGVLRNTGQNARAGKGKPFVVEADEYDNMFLGLRPKVAIVTNIEHDHPDQFKSLDEVRASFEKFVALLPDDGLLVTCHDDQEALKLADKRRQAGKPVITYGLEPGADMRAVEVISNNQGGSDFIVRDKRLMRGMVRIGVPGKHNVQNALAVFVLAKHFDVQFEIAAAVLNEFQGVKRRFEVKGRVAGITSVDDYAHHPTAIKATLKAARARYGRRGLWAVFQPHTFTRTVALKDELALAFEEADHVIVTDIYASREKDDLGVSAKDILAVLKQHPDARHIADLDEVVKYVSENVESGDVVVTMSAGDATRVSSEVLDALQERFQDKVIEEGASLTSLREEFMAELKRQERAGLLSLEESKTWREFIDEATLTPSLMRRLLDRLRKSDHSSKGKSGGDAGED